ncbi:MAG: hypothetical protein Fues2KO_13650 [Fuerstiella sp.]
MLSGIIKTGKRIGAAIVLLLLAVVGAEVWLQITTPPPVPTVCPQTTPEAQPLLVPSATTHHELRRLTTLTLPNGEALRTNSLGLRGPEFDRESKQSLRVIMLGDETVLGLNHAEAQTLPSLLKRFLVKSTGREVEVINAGVPGYAPVLSGIQFRQQLLSLKPDIVLLHFDMNDVADDSYYRRLLKTSDQTKICDHPLLQPRPPTAALRLSRQSALLRSIQTALVESEQTAGEDDLVKRYRWTLPDSSDLRLPIQQALLPVTDLASVCSDQNLPLLICSCPVPWQVAARNAFEDLARQLRNTNQWPVSNDLPNRILQAACNRCDALYCDARTAFGTFQHPEALYEGQSVQLSALGNSLYAREIASTILTTPRVAGLFRTTTTAQTPTGNER